VDPGNLTEEQADWLKPRLALLPPNTRAQIDFTAYTLEWGEIKLGLANIQVGVLPNVQLGTSLPLDILGAPNADLKIDFLRLGPLDVAATGSYYMIKQEQVDFKASYANLGGMLSLEILEKWSLHGGATYGWVSTQGFPDLDALAGVLQTDDLGDFSDELIQELGDAQVDARMLQVKAATDIRFNRRDSIVLQLGSTPYAKVTTDPVPEEVPPIAGLDKLLALDGTVPVTQSYTVSIAYQLQWKRTQLRLGIGHSSTPGAWLLQTMDFNVRFLGATRLKELRQRRTWRNNMEKAREGEFDGAKEGEEPKTDGD